MKPLAALLAAVICTAPLDERPDGPGVELAGTVVQVPMSHAGGYVAVDVLINGQGPFRFQVDTYASIDACIDDDLARELGLGTTGTTSNSDGHTTRERDLTVIDELRLGGATFTHLRTLIDDYDSLPRSGGKRVRGLLGFTLFRDLLLTIDYPGSRLVLEHGALSPDDPHVMRFTTPRGAPDINLRIGAESFRAGIDTGTRTALSLDLREAARVDLASELLRTGTARTVYTEYALFGASLADPVELAGHRLEDITVSFGEGQGQGLIGHGLLQPFRVSFDQRRKLVRFLIPPVPS